MNYYNNYEDMFYHEEEVKTIKVESIQDTTLRLMKLFIKENKQLIKHITNSYNGCWEDLINAKSFNEHTLKLKENATQFFVDVYYDNDNIYNHIDERSYVMYVHRLINKEVKKIINK